MAREDRESSFFGNLPIASLGPNGQRVSSMQDDSIETSMSDSVKLGIVIHRMGALESGMADIGHKIDNMGTMYPTMMHIDLLLKPMRDKIDDLEGDKKEKEREQATRAGQLKIAIIMALFSPIVSILITLLLDNRK